MNFKFISIGICFAALAAQAQVQSFTIPKRIVQRPSDSTSAGGVAVVAIPQNLCTTTNNNCYNTNFPQAPGSAATIRPWTSYFLGQSKSSSELIGYTTARVYDPTYDGYVNTQVPRYAYTTVNIDAAGVIYARQTGSLFYSAIGTPSGFENVTWTARGACVVSPTWSNNSNKLAGLPPDGWAHSGQLNGTNVGCGYLVESALNGAAGDGG